MLLLVERLMIGGHARLVASPHTLRLAVRRAYVWRSWQSQEQSTVDNVSQHFATPTDTQVGQLDVDRGTPDQHVPRCHVAVDDAVVLEERQGRSDAGGLRGAVQQ